MSHKLWLMNYGSVRLVFLFHIFRLGDPFGKELTIFNFEDIFRNGQGAIQAKYVRAFGEFKMPMGVEIMSVSHIFKEILQNKPTI